MAGLIKQAGKNHESVKFKHYTPKIRATRDHTDRADFFNIIVFKIYVLHLEVLQLQSGSLPTLRADGGYIHTCNLYANAMISAIYAHTRTDSGNFDQKAINCTQADF